MLSCWDILPSCAGSWGTAPWGLGSNTQSLIDAFGLCASWGILWWLSLSKPRPHTAPVVSWWDWAVVCSFPPRCAHQPPSLLPCVTPGSCTLSIKSACRLPAAVGIPLADTLRCCLLPPTPDAHSGSRNKDLEFVLQEVLDAR